LELSWSWTSSPLRQQTRVPRVCAEAKPDSNFQQAAERSCSQHEATYLVLRVDGLSGVDLVERHVLKELLLGLFVLNKSRAKELRLRNQKSKLLEPRRDVVDDDLCATLETRPRGRRNIGNVLGAQNV
jgi:hypothetical protein